jgi:hypothetical protein
MSACIYTLILNCLLLCLAYGKSQIFSLNKTINISSSRCFSFCLQETCAVSTSNIFLFILRFFVINNLCSFESRTMLVNCIPYGNIVESIQLVGKQASNAMARVHCSYVFSTGDQLICSVCVGCCIEC